MSGVPPFQWEDDLSATVGLTISEFRFAVSFFLSVFISWCWRFVPTSQGTRVIAGFACSYTSHASQLLFEVVQDVTYTRSLPGSA